MKVWGIYLEDNTQKVADATRADCRQLRRATEDALDLGAPGCAASGCGTGEARLTAPRCRAATSKSPEQGPLRCSLARLAWESCSASWDHEPAAKGAPLVQEDARERPGASDMVRLIERSAIHGVDPSLVRGGLPV